MSNRCPTSPPPLLHFITDLVNRVDKRRPGFRFCDGRSARSPVALICQLHGQASLGFTLKEHLLAGLEIMIINNIINNNNNNIIIIIIIIITITT